MPDDAASKHFMLTAEQREQLIPNIDVGALERFLEFAANSTEERDALLRAFTRTFSGPNTSFQLIGVATADSARARAITALLDEIWAPTWEAWGRDAIAHSDSRLPGREIARARLAMKPPPGTD